MAHRIKTKSVSKTSTVIFSLPYKKRYLASMRLRAHERRRVIKASGRYTCQQCVRTFVQQSSLVTHLRIHTGEKPFVCEVCDKAYGDLSTFTKHKRTHTGEKPYACPVCERRFSQSGNCLRHYRAIHNKDQMSEESFQKHFINHQNCS